MGVYSFSLGNATVLPILVVALRSCSYNELMNSDVRAELAHYVGTQTVPVLFANH